MVAYMVHTLYEKWVHLCTIGSNNTNVLVVTILTSFGSLLCSTETSVMSVPGVPSCTRVPGYSQTKTKNGECTALYCHFFCCTSSSSGSR